MLWAFNPFVENAMIATAPTPSFSRFFASSRLGSVSVPGPVHGSREAGFSRDDARELLLTLGRQLGLNAQTPQGEWVDSRSLELFSDEAVLKAFECLDLVWLDDQGPVAGFVFEPGDGLFEGPRRLADLLALYPKLKTSLYVVTMPSLREKLVEEIHRPIYRLLKKSLGESTRCLVWPQLLSEVTQIGDRARYLKPDFLNGISDVIAVQESSAN
jgi:hypothetical protein